MDSEKRFFIDQRCGCIAIRDRQNTDPEYPGLHEDTQGVVWFRRGVQKDLPPCPTCHRGQGKVWEVPEEIIKEAEKECERLNG